MGGAPRNATFPISLVPSNMTKQGLGRFVRMATGTRLSTENERVRAAAVLVRRQKRELPGLRTVQCNLGEVPPTRHGRVAARDERSEQAATHDKK